MQYIVSFLEGIITFISPCLLPMLPIYVTYFACGGERGPGTTLKNALGFVLGFTVIFTAMGALAGTVGSFLTEHQTMVNIVSGLVVIFFGLCFLGVFRINIFRGTAFSARTENLGFFSSALLGIIFSVGWTPLCRGVPWIRSHAGFATRPYVGRHHHASLILRRTRHPIRHQRFTDRQAQISLLFHKRSLSHHKHHMRLSADSDRHTDGFRSYG